MKQVVGYRNYSFKAEDGKEISGCTLYLTDDSSERVVGVATLSVSVSDRVLTDCGYTPNVGDVIQYIGYNDRKKVDMIIPDGKF